VQVADLKRSLTEMKDMIQEMKKNFIPSDADCTGMVGYEKEIEGDGLTAK